MKFITDLRLYIQNSFFDDYARTKEFKNSKVLENCYEHLDTQKDGRKKVIEYIEMNAKCKLQLTDREIKKPRVR